ncbi:hypothetical protein L202_07259 [Cryptococcus amylolentus CBS 6039]|uniref:Uncharacterized protein n=1 Tax=Cryptococcus amylolentus CBS 6039 TaxID=1295533 RepID=A0A1E3HBJ6_9TREE|nr:hypothetical protein L202_07259 [Cryptococcus amylolentus CBS 6039]ODN73719.1 hypothetical protein L202_07259 [Cryptococcus amylolentus CBS 6039]
MAGSLWNPDTASTVGRTPGLGYHTLDPSSDSVQTASVRPWRVAEGGAAALGPGELLEYQQIKWSRERDEAALKAALGRHAPLPHEYHQKEFESNPSYWCIDNVLLDEMIDTLSSNAFFWAVVDGEIDDVQSLSTRFPGATVGSYQQIYFNLAQAPVEHTDWNLWQGSKEEELRGKNMRRGSLRSSGNGIAMN